MVDPVGRLRAARRDPTLAVLEGLHALKHALRFGAAPELVLTPDRAALRRVAARLAPDVAATIDAHAQEVDRALFARLAPRPPATGVIALARRPAVDVAAALDPTGTGPVVLLEEPRRLGNVGACIRVAAAAGAAAVLTTGAADPWHPDALRGAAGLHFALPVLRLAAPPRGALPLVAVDPAGAPVAAGQLPRRCILAFGTEREGLSAALLAEADRRVCLPMRAGVSSLNLATAVAAMLYGPLGPDLPAPGGRGH